MGAKGIGVVMNDRRQFGRTFALMGTGRRDLVSIRNLFLSKKLVDPAKLSDIVLMSGVKVVEVCDW